MSNRSLDHLGDDLSDTGHHSSRTGKTEERLPVPLKRYTSKVALEFIVDF